MPRPTKVEITKYRAARRRAAVLRLELAGVEQDLAGTEDKWLAWLEDLGTDAADADGYRIAVASGEPGTVNWEQAFRWAMGDAEADGLKHRVAAGRAPKLLITRLREKRKSG